MSAQNIAEPLSPAPVPGVMSSYNHGWSKLWKYFLMLLLLGIVYGILSSLFDSPSYWKAISGDWSAFTESNPGNDLLSFLYSFFVSVPLYYGLLFVYLQAARGARLGADDLFVGFRNYWSAVLSYILTILIVIAGFMLFIIPGIICGIKLTFVPYLVTDKKMKAMDAIKESWRMTNGHAWTVFGIYILGIPVVILGALVFVVGVIPAIMLVMLAEASLYYAISAAQNKAAAHVVDAAGPVA